MSSMVELPDFDSMAERINKIRDLMLSELQWKAIIRDEEAKVSLLAVTNTKYFIDGKVPSQAFIDRTYIPSGFDGELLDMRKELAKVTADLEHQKNMLDLEKTLIEIWRTQSANERKATL